MSVPLPTISGSSVQPEYAATNISFQRGVKTVEGKIVAFATLWITAHKADFADVRLVTVEKVFGGWGEVMKTHFGEGGVLDQVFVNR